MHTMKENQDKVKMRNREKNMCPQCADDVRKAQAQFE